MPRGDLSVIRNSKLSSAIRHQARRKQDVFAIGVMIYKAMAGRLPYQIDAEKFPLPEAYRSINSLRPGAVPQEFDLLLSRMLDFDNNTRIGGTEAWNEFNRILARYPQVKAEIAANMQTLGFNSKTIA
jgi:serine/threonine protein kinase